MNKSIKRVEVGEGLTRVTVQVNGDPSPNDAKGLFELIRHLADQPFLLSCEAPVPETLTFRHNGENWVFEAQAVVEKVNNEETKPRGSAS